MRAPLRVRFAISGAVATLASAVLAFPAAAQTARRPAAPAAQPAQPASQMASEMAAWVIATGDNRGLPFVIVDKAAAEVVIYDAKGVLRGVSPALIGSAVGDHSVPGVGDKPLSAIRPDERTTPAGRFVAAYGPAPKGQKVLWVDYATAISLHPVATGVPSERRLERIRSASPQDNRITYGCINVPAAFYQNVVRKTLSDTKSVFYVLPETQSLQDVFPAFHTYALGGASPATTLGAALPPRTFGAW